MAGGGDDERAPATFPPRRNTRRPRGSVYERSLELQKEGPCSSSPSVSSSKSPLQRVTPVQPPKSLDSPLQMVTPVQLLKTLDSGSSSCSSGLLDLWDLIQELPHFTYA